jgi:hypothetical protein
MSTLCCCRVTEIVTDDRRRCSIIFTQNHLRCYTFWQGDRESDQRMTIQMTTPVASTVLLIQQSDYAAFCYLPVLQGDRRSDQRASDTTNTTV